MPKFTKGQKVQSNRTIAGTGITKGSTYEVIETAGTSPSVRVFNDRGIARWVSETYFEPVPTRQLRIDLTPEGQPLGGKRWIISMIENGVLKPAREPRQYATEKQAHAVAKEMAEKHRGNVFVVFEATGFTFVPTSTETVVHAL